MDQELKKLIESKIIYPIKHSTCVSNLVPVKKKNKDIQLCVDFRDLNQASLKDHYPLPSMEQLLSTVVGSKMFSMLDGFLGYNQVLVKPEDQHKMTFTTKWETFAYQKMPFGLSNVNTNFQRAMELPSRSSSTRSSSYIWMTMVFSKHKEDHFDHLEPVFQKCLEFGISLNPKNFIFRVPQGKLLGNIVSKEGVSIKPN